MSCGCSWATGAHMTKFSTYGTGVHVAGTLGVSRGGQSTKGAYVFGTLGANMVSGLTVEASYHGRCGRGGVRDVNGVGAGAGSHNHLQSSRQSNMSRAHCQSSSSVNSRPTSLSWSNIPSVMFLGGKGVQLAKGKWVCAAGQLGVTVQGRGLIFSVVHFPPLTDDSPFTFTILVIFFADTFRYLVW